jgi:hypothetical protein
MATGIASRRRRVLGPWRRTPNALPGSIVASVVTTSLIALIATTLPVSAAGSWSDPVLVDAGSPLQGGGSSISCPNPTFCMAIDIEGFVATYDGTQWSSPPAVRESPRRQPACSRGEQLPRTPAALSAQ